MNIDEIKAALAKAYPQGVKWEFDPAGWRDSNRKNEVFWKMSDGSHLGKICDVLDERNGPLIANAPAYLAFLIAELEAAKMSEAKVSEELYQFKEGQKKWEFIDGLNAPAWKQRCESAEKRLALAMGVVEAARVIMTPMPKEVHTDDRKYNDEVYRRGAVMRGALAAYDQEKKP